VRLRLFHADLFAAYGAGEGRQISLRLPYDVKDQRVRYTTLDGGPFVPPYGDIHHRTETLWGVSDAELLGWRTLSALGSALGQWILGAGLTLPIGRTEPDPIRLGREGKKHEHIQFGDGTFDPKLVLSGFQRAGRILFGEAVEARVPLYQSSRGYRAPFQLVWSVGPSLPIGRFFLSVQYAGQYQTVGRWHGEADEGTGFQNGGIALRAGLHLAPNTSLSAGVYRELYVQGFADQTFHQGATYSLSLSRTLP